MTWLLSLCTLIIRYSLVNKTYIHVILVLIGSSLWNNHRDLPPVDFAAMKSVQKEWSPFNIVIKMNTSICRRIILKNNSKHDYVQIVLRCIVCVSAMMRGTYESRKNGWTSQDFHSRSRLLKLYTQYLARYNSNFFSLWSGLSSRKCISWACGPWWRVSRPCGLWRRCIIRRSCGCTVCGFYFFFCRIRQTGRQASTGAWRCAGQICTGGGWPCRELQERPEDLF